MENELWNEATSIPSYSQPTSQYQEHILEQYKLCVTMADQVSARRNLANVFFASINTTMLGVIAFYFEKLQTPSPKNLIIIPILGAILLCGIWCWTIWSYLKLNTTKFKVIAKLEEQLPTNAFKTEWIELGEGKDLKKYNPLSKIEMIVPMLFAILYAVIAYYNLSIE